MLTDRPDVQGHAAVLARAVRRWLLAGPRRRTLRRRTVLAQLDPRTDHHQIVRELATREFPWDWELAMSFALFRTYASPSISRLLVETGEFINRPRKRYDDTELLLAELNEHDADGPRVRTALRRINQMHGAYDIPAEDMRYVLATFVVEPIRWLDQYGWRPLTATEREALLQQWRELGARMGVRQVPVELDELVAEYDAYEATNFRPDPANRAIADATMSVFLSRLPRSLRRPGRALVVSLLDPPVRRAFGYPAPPQGAVRAVRGILALRARLMRELPERVRPVQRTQRHRPTYPNGYQVHHLGTFPAATPEVAA